MSFRDRFVGHLDSPPAGQISGSLLQASGWVLAKRGGEVKLEFSLGEEPVPAQVSRGPRPDVHNHRPKYKEGNPLPGFSAVLDLHGRPAGEWELVCRASQGRHASSSAASGRFPGGTHLTALRI